MSADRAEGGVRVRLAEGGLRFEAVAAGYADGAVVGDVVLEVRPGDVVGLVGPNGAGKSTLLKAVTGAARVLGGHLLIGGADAAVLAPRERARLVGVVPQTLAAEFSFTAEAYVGLGRTAWLGNMRSPGPEDTAVVRRAMERTDTLRLAGERVDTLSGGDLQRLALAQALAQEPRILLLDEPTSHLDLNHRLQVLDLVRELADDGLAVLAVFHDLDLAARYSDRLAVVAEGTVGPVGPPADVLSADLVARVFGVRAVVGADPVTGAVAVTPILRDDALAHARGAGVFLVSGSGTGAGLMRRLSLAGFAVSAGALSRGDTDQSVAEALGLARVDLPPFAMPGADEVQRVRALAASARARVVCATPFGPPNVANLAAAVEAGPPLVLVGVLDASLDFSGGEATALWRRALEAGALQAAGADEAVLALERVLREDVSGDGRATDA